MTWIDAAIVAALLGGMVLGYRRGLIRQIVSLTGWLIAYVAAFLFFDDIAEWLAGLAMFAPTEPAAGAEGTASSTLLRGAGTYVTRAAAFALLFFGTKAALSLLGAVLHGVASLPALRTVNRTGGALLALAETVVLVVILLYIFQELPLERTQNWAAESVLFNWVKANLPLMLPGNWHSLWQGE